MTYEYLWYPEVLTPITMGSGKMVQTALANIGNPTNAQIAASTAMQTKLVNALVAVMQKHTGFTLTTNEVALIKEVVSYYKGSNAMLYGDPNYGCYRALATIISARSHVGWTTWGHTGVDVNLYSYGQGSDRVGGSIENTEVALRIEKIMGWDLKA